MEISFGIKGLYPLKFKKLSEKHLLKFLLRTNKISTAVQRSKLQALEHKKMFNEILNKPNYFSKVFNKKKIDTKKNMNFLFLMNTKI